MPRIIRIALCQLTSAPTVEEGFKKVDKTIEDVSRQRADIAIFPEFFVQGIVQDAPHKIPAEGEWEDHVRNLAIKHKIDICIGTFAERVQERKDDKDDERDEEREGVEKTYNTAYYFTKAGELVGKYRKRNLWHPEKDYLHPGLDSHLVFQSSHCKTGMLVCWDLAWPEAFRALFLQNVELILVPSYWVASDLTDEGREHDPNADGEKAWLDSLVITRAYENECVVAFVNVGGREEEGFLGRSAVAAPFKGCVGRTGRGGEEVKVVEVDLDVLKAARNVYKMKPDYLHAIKNDGFSHPLSE